jgi:signal transduction histidine kinase
LGVTSSRIAVLDDEMQTATLVAQHCSVDADEAEEVSSVGEVYELGDLPVTTQALMNRQPLLLTAGEEVAEWRATIARRSGQAMLLLPLVARDQVTGFVELWDSRSRRRFTEAAIALAQTFTNQAAVAMDNARLFAETQRRLNELTLLYDMAVAAASTRDLDSLLQSVVKTLQFRVLEESTVSVLLLDEERRQLRLRAHAGEIAGGTRLETLSLDEDIPSQVVEGGQVVLISDAQQDPRCASYGPAIRSVLCVPLAWGRRVTGVLQALSGQENAFSGHDRRLLHTMASSLAIAIENVRLFTELRHSEEALTLRNQALERANERFQELDRLKSAFIASVSHELRTPLNSIIGFSEVLIDGLVGELEPLVQEYLSYIHSSGKHLLDLINDILDLSKIQAGHMTLNLDPTEVMQVLEDVRATLAPLIGKKNQTFDIEQEGPLKTLVGDRFRLKQILLNLVGNANKFTQEGGQIKVRALMADAVTLRLDVLDNGPGIRLEDQGLIFEEFRQAGTARPPGEGTGLGLAITRRLVELHGGHVWVESELGAGSVFTVLLPVAGTESVGREDEEEVRGGPTG